jgi:hypothetical protein
MARILETIFPRVRQSLRRRGVIGTLGRGLAWPLSDLRNRREFNRQRLGYQASRFDTDFGVETGGLVRWSDLKVDSTNWIHSADYYPASVSVFRQAFEDLNVKWEEFTFVDFGSGKGRALLLASEFPFKKIIGVEHSRELNVIAERNLRRYRSDTQRCHDLELVCLDFTAFPVPAGPLVCFIYNPADEVVMSKVSVAIERSWRESPRQIYIVYLTPDYAHLFDSAGYLRRVKSGDQYVVYGSAAA